MANTTDMLSCQQCHVSRTGNYTRLALKVQTTPTTMLTLLRAFAHPKTVFENTYFTFFSYLKNMTFYVCFEMTLSKSRKKSLIFPSNRLLKLKLWLDYDANIIT